MATRGTKAGESKYSRLKSMIERDLFNQNWVEENTTGVKRNSDSFEFIDIFSGAGGIACGLRSAGYNLILSNEMDRDASATMRLNFPEAKHIEGLIEEMSIRKEMPQFQSGSLPLLIGGPPCQGFSVAGLRRPEDARNQMFHEYMRILEETEPWFAVLENVPGIITLEKGKFKDRIIESFKQHGYDVSLRILEAAEFGVPQLRTRAIFVANRFGLPNPYPKPARTRDNYVPIEEAIIDLADLPPTPEINHEWTKHTKQMEKRLAAVKPGESLYSTYKDAWKRQYMGAPAMTIKENHGGTHIHPWLNRVISAREMARLQTFPDDYIFEGTMKRAMWQVGNAVPPKLAEQVGIALLPSLRRIRDQLA